MRLSTYWRPDGSVGHGRVVDDGARVEDLGDGDPLAVVAGEEPADGPARASYAWDELTILAPVLAPATVLCVATNYQEHIVEGGGDRVDPTRVSPKLFMKPPASVIGDGATYKIPEISAAADWEAELCVVIGSGGRAIAEERALDHVFGYAASNDISLRKLAVGYDRDVNLTGTPAGVGATTGTYLTDGDVMVADLGPVGRLTTYVTGRSTEV